MSVELGMDGPGDREAKAALSVPLQKFPGEAPSPPAGACARGDCRDALGRFLCFTALEKSRGLGKSHQAKGDILTHSCVQAWATTSMGESVCCRLCPWC